MGASLLLGLSALGTNAWAQRPDFDGERGLELHGSFGVGAFTTNTASLFVMRGSPASDAAVLNAGFAMDLGLGYRPVQFLSFGAHFGLMTGRTQPNLFLTYNNWFAFGVGAYVRFYPMPLILGTREDRRVRFDSYGSARRFDPWIEVGIDPYQNVAVSVDGASASRTSLGVPLGLGLEYRLLPALALGLAARFTPWFGSGVRQEARAGGAVVGINYDSPVGVNLGITFGLSVRYTFTL